MVGVTDLAFNRLETLKTCRSLHGMEQTAEVKSLEIVGVNGVHATQGTVSFNIEMFLHVFASGPPLSLLSRLLSSVMLRHFIVHQRGDKRVVATELEESYHSAYPWGIQLLLQLLLAVGVEVDTLSVLQVLRKMDHSRAPLMTGKVQEAPGSVTAADVPGHLLCGLSLEDSPWFGRTPC